MGEPDLRRLSGARRVALLAGPVLAAALGLSLALGTELPRPACWTAAITTLCAVWWIFEPIPLAATSLVPFAALPLAGVLSHQEVATAYGHHLVLLMLAGSIVASAMEKSGAHRRVALTMVRTIGGRGGRRISHFISLNHGRTPASGSRLRALSAGAPGPSSATRASL